MKSVQLTAEQTNQLTLNRADGPEDRETVAKALDMDIGFDLIIGWLVRYGPRVLALLREILDAWPDITVERMIEWYRTYGADLAALVYEILEALGGYAAIQAAQNPGHAHP